ncbi:MAG: DUF4249 family protein [Chloroflexi bacterium]|nr:DUF4249 family protein [Chloroflexota bacterium]
MATIVPGAVGPRRFLRNPILMKPWSVIVLALFFSHCAVPVELEFESGYVPKVVVNAEFTPDDEWTVQLSRSVAYTDSIDWSRHVLTNASVEMHDPQGGVESLIHRGEGVYQSPESNTPRADIQYTIVVDAPGLPKAQASSMAPSAEAALVDLREVSSADSTKRSFRIRLRIVDQPGQDYYSLDVKHLQPSCRNEEGRLVVDQVASGGTIHNYTRFDSNFHEMRETIQEVNDPSSPWPFESGFGYGTSYFSDRSFEGESKLIELAMDVPRYEALVPYIQISVANWSEELWFYTEYLFLPDIFDLNVFEGVPKVTYSNVSGGLGVFGGIDYEYFRIDHEGVPWNEEDLQVDVIESCAQ